MRRLLIANRGEIACRIARTARRMGIGVIAVYSDADAGALHVREADKAVRIGPAPASESYLNIAAVVQAARQAGADAVHPGYGFLSENADFAEAVRDAGMIFVGPPPQAIALMGDKRAAKALARAAGVPVVPGDHGENQDDGYLAEEAAKIGWPVLIKAAAGGGGRGMRIVRGAAEFPQALASARREAKSAFGNDAVLLEKLIEDGRHVEVQVFGDRSGNCMHLFERDCTAQRRHQKIIEEAPSPAVDEALRAKLGQWAVALARAAKYENAGTVEFLLDSAGNAFFLEMNTRLQVEHPVTEMVTGIDLVEWQLRIGRGEELPLRQEEIVLHGHAIEARLYAEDPARDFLPQTGRISHFSGGMTGSNGRRIDAGFAEGDEVGPHYDAMIAKFVSHGPTREDAVGVLCAMLEESPVVGVANNAGFLHSLLTSPEFRQARLTTQTIDRWVAEGDARLSPPAPEPVDFAHAVAALALAPGGTWFRSSGFEAVPIDLICGEQQQTAVLGIERGKVRAATVGGHEIVFEAIDYRAPWLTVAADGRIIKRRAFVDGSQAILLKAAHLLQFCEPDLLAPKKISQDPRRLVSPVSGVASKVMVQPGERVSAGQTLATIEAMKMETRVIASAGGRVAAVRIAEGAQVVAGDVIAEIEPDDAADA